MILSEQHYMAQDSSQDMNCKDGKAYSWSMYLWGIDQTAIRYQFYFDDGKNQAKGNPNDTKGDPTHDRYLILNHKPEIKSSSVNPVQGEGGREFTFKVAYRDEDNNAPMVYQVWIDEDGDGIYRS